mmetsp:Transcript_3242/g.11194  ORF Transcript_3242/g.11194 Transcript_3242/m.11194 type:complete len:117 (-) Transcript_3242:193-543(-)
MRFSRGGSRPGVTAGAGTVGTVGRTGAGIGCGSGRCGEIAGNAEPGALLPTAGAGAIVGGAAGGGGATSRIAVGGIPPLVGGIPPLLADGGAKANDPKPAGGGGHCAAAGGWPGAG